MNSRTLKICWGVFWIVIFTLPIALFFAKPGTWLPPGPLSNLYNTALIECVGRLLNDNEQVADEAVCLCFGLNLLNKSYNDLDHAVAQLRRATDASKVARPNRRTARKVDTSRHQRRRSRKAE